MLPPFFFPKKHKAAPESGFCELRAKAGQKMHCGALPDEARCISHRSTLHCHMHRTAFPIPQQEHTDRSAHNG